MSEKKAEFNFEKLCNDIGFSKTTMEYDNKEEKKYQYKRNRYEELSGIMISIPTEHNRIWVVKDLYDCSTLEFKQWFKYIFPVDYSAEEKTSIDFDFTQNINRFNMFQKVLNFYSLFYYNKASRKSKC